MLPTYAKKSIELLLNYLGKGKPALTLNGVETVKSAAICPEMQTEQTTIGALLANKPGGTVAVQIKKLIRNEVLVTMLPNLHIVAAICLTIPLSIASIERSFFKMKLIKTHLQNSFSESRLSHIMKITIEYAEELTENEVEAILEVWNRKLPRLCI